MGQTLDHVKDWLNSVDIRYTEGVQSLNWSKIMKAIVEDVDGFFEDGGWNFLDSNQADEAEMEEDSDSEDDEFRMSESDASDVNDEDSEDDYSSEDVSEDEDLSGELDSDESEGKDWSDLEREAAESMKMVMMIIIPEGIGICIRNINIIKGHRSRVHLRHHDDIISIITKAQAHLNLKTITVIVIA